MKYKIAQGIQVSLDYNPSNQTGTWYKLSDHNRQPIGITYNLIESTDRMANGTLRKYIVARKFVITADWNDFPTIDSNLVDYENPVPSSSPYGPFAAAWIKAFYEGNYGNPIYVKLVFAKETSVLNSVPSSSTYTDSKNTPLAPEQAIYNAYMTTFTYDITKRRSSASLPQTTSNHGYDYVNMKIEFTEI